MGVKNTSQVIVFLAAILVALSAMHVSLGKKPQKKDPARRLYAKRCAGACHRLYKPGEFTGDRWIEILDKMSARAKLTESEAKTLRAYLLQNSAKEETEKAR
jgi:hypothetical protein